MFVWPGKGFLKDSLGQVDNPFCLAVAAEAPLVEFKEAVAAAAALGLAAYKLEQAQQQVVERNRQAQLTLQSTVETAPFSPAAFQASEDGLKRLPKG